MSPDSANTNSTDACQISADPQITITLPIFIQLGSELAPYADPQKPEGQVFREKLAELRSSLYIQLGIIFPPIQITLSALRSANNNFCIWLNEVPTARGYIHTDETLVNAPLDKLSACGIEGEETTNPASGKPACWIPCAERPAADALGLQVWDTHEVLTLHLASFLRRHAHEFIGPQEVHWTLDAIGKHCPVLVDEVIPKLLSLPQLTQILRMLAEEGVSIRDMKTILECLSEHASGSREIAKLVEQVRIALRRKICFTVSEGRPVLFAYVFDQTLQELIQNGVRDNSEGSYLAMDPEQVDLVVSATRKEIALLPQSAPPPAIVTSKDIRRLVRQLLARDFPNVSVLSYQEISPEIELKILGRICEQKGPNTSGPNRPVAEEQKATRGPRKNWRLRFLSFGAKWRPKA